eukprot:CAMPEP_0174276152 /NCGR_PEP_ID=MMETSP0439-20130205/60225_1 /TAXON_ID=0 /ORGANISM="Stereomyxa ramosa, Strain Chinc5" /LENGTH=174 /DNA_ID=CAMNT_0015368343 /DNA_START=695 /DNA_END=1219 /DNA_ORIENTATION=-
MANKISEEELKELRAEFDRMDVNGDGVISLEELIAEMIDEEASDAECRLAGKVALKEMDANGDGEISWDEFVCYCTGFAPEQEKIMSPGETKIMLESAQLLFKGLDRDGNGMLDKEEMKLGLKLWGCDWFEGDFDTKWKELDANGDGVLSFEEFKDFIFNTYDSVSQLTELSKS